MRILSKWAVAGGLFTLGTLAGCGGGNNSSSGTPLSTTGTRSDSPVAPIRVAYTVTDLGATEYYYSYFGYISNRYRYSGVLRINDAGLIITNSNSSPVLYNGQPIRLQVLGYSASVNGINNTGMVTGSSYSNSGGHATLWSESIPRIVDLGFSNTWSVAYALNDAGAVVGEATQGGDWYSTATKATLWQDGQQITLGSLGGNYSLAYGINNSGSVVGWSQVIPSTSGPYYNYNSPVHAFVWNSGTMTDLGLLPGGESSDAQDINDSGQIVGSAETTAKGLYLYRALHAVTWKGGTIGDLGTLGGPGSIGYALNNSGMIVGSGDTSTLAPQSTYYGWYYGYGSVGGGGGTAGGGTGGGGSSPGGGTGGNAGGGTGNNTPPLAGGAGGRSVKSAQGTRSSHSSTSRGIGDTYVSHAFRYVNGKMEDLNAFIDPDNGWELLTATDINASGQIVGYGKYGNKQHAFLLTPVQ